MHPRSSAMDVEHLMFCKGIVGFVLRKMKDNKNRKGIWIVMDAAELILGKGIVPSAKRRVMTEEATEVTTEEGIEEGIEVTTEEGIELRLSAMDAANPESRQGIAILAIIRVEEEEGREEEDRKLWTVMDVEDLILGRGIAVSAIRRMVVIKREVD